ncbi:hypothetical protein U5922_017540 [Aquicoccus sp. G2-2]|uniref:hypothetical protein n=1 Tax=Aquicoccus sp. G2-2 TaxID=3092120 RepID=UPI002AE01C18|nr:hypothetical protein [Aquicoccus sp. G2-2]MEA1115182.1 hypothetical protein [Aquicoccus sp. G2-2]
MGWFAISDTEANRFCGAGLEPQSARAPVLRDGCPVRGSLLVETRLSADGRPQELLSFERAYPRPYKFSLQAVPGAGWC